MTPRNQTDALRGSLDLLVLKTLSLQPMHGWGISQRIQQFSSGALEVNQGSLYPALQRLEKDGLITSEWVRPCHGKSSAAKPPMFPTLLPP